MKVQTFRHNFQVSRCSGCKIWNIFSVFCYVLTHNFRAPEEQLNLNIFGWKLAQTLIFTFLIPWHTTKFELQYYKEKWWHQITYQFAVCRQFHSRCYNILETYYIHCMDCMGYSISHISHCHEVQDILPKIENVYKMVLHILLNRVTTNPRKALNLIFLIPGQKKSRENTFYVKRYRKAQNLDPIKILEETGCPRL